MTDIPDKTALLETMSETRIELLYLEQKAREEGDKAAAQKLAERGAALKARIAELRDLSHAAWAEAAGPLAEQFRRAQSGLEEIQKRDEKRRDALNAAAKALGAVDDVLALVGKILK